MGSIYKNYGVLNKNSKAERLFDLTFTTQAIMISKMDEYEKAEMVKEIDGITLYLYEEAAKLDQFERVPGCPFPIPLLSPDAYMCIMGKIKRWEILLNYLYEINNLLTVDHLQEKIREMEQEYANIDTEYGKKYVPKRVAARYDSYKADLKAAQPHTFEIADMAKDLTSKYFK